MNDDFDVRLGMLLREEREKKGITLQEIAVQFGTKKTAGLLRRCSSKLLDFLN